MDLLGPLAATLGLVFGASLVGSPHCAGMCGPLLAFVHGGRHSASPVSAARVQTAYHGARGLSYTLLGAVAGAIGQAADLGSTWAGIGRVSSIVAGVFLVGWALARVWPKAWIRRKRRSGPSLVQRGLARVGRWVGPHPTARATVLGLASALLPCGWLFAFVAVAGGTGSLLHGALIMTAFWAGTVPVLLGVGLGWNRLAASRLTRKPIVTTLVLTALGLWMITNRVDIDLLAASRSPVAEDSASADTEETTGRPDSGSSSPATLVLPDADTSCCNAK